MESQVVLNGFNGLKYEAISAISTFKTHVFFSTQSMPSLWGSKLSLDPESAASFLELCFQPWTSHEFSSVRLLLSRPLIIFSSASQRSLVFHKTFTWQVTDL